MDDLFALRVQRRVELGMRLERCHHRLEHKGGQRQPPAPLLNPLLVPPSQQLQVGHVGPVLMVDVRNLGPRQCHVLGRRPAHRAQRHTVDRAPAGKIGQWGDRHSRWAQQRRSHRLRSQLGRRCRLRWRRLLRQTLTWSRPPVGKRPHVITGHPPGRTRPPHLAQVDAQLARQPARRRRSRHRPLVIDHRSGHHRPGRLAGHLLCRRRRLDPLRRLAVAKKDHLVADVNHVAGPDPNRLHGAGERRRDLDRRLVRLDLQNGLIFSDLIADVHQHPDHFTFVDSLSQIRESE